MTNNRTKKQVNYDELILNKMFPMSSLASVQEQIMQSKLAAHSCKYLPSTWRKKKTWLTLAIFLCLVKSLGTPILFTLTDQYEIRIAL